MKNKQQLRENNPEMKSVNENIYDMFSVDELEERLQMSALFWGCGTNCSTVGCTTVGCSCDGFVGCSPDCQILEQCFPVVLQ
jgi:hypothetical protein